MDDIKIWQFCASKDDKQEINSNYGWCVFSEANGSQYEHCLKHLKEDPFTREAMIIYTRPSIQDDCTAMVNMISYVQIILISLFVMVD